MHTDGLVVKYSAETEVLNTKNVNSNHISEVKAQTFVRLK